LEAYFNEEEQKIKNLSQDILSKLQNALNFNIEEHPLRKLKLLEAIDKNIVEINDNVSAAIKDNRSFVTHYPADGNGHSEIQPPRKRSFWRKLFPFLKH